MSNLATVEHSHWWRLATRNAHSSSVTCITNTMWIACARKTWHIDGATNRCTMSLSSESVGSPLNRNQSDHSCFDPRHKSKKNNNNSLNKGLWSFIVCQELKLSIIEKNLPLLHTSEPWSDGFRRRFVLLAFLASLLSKEAVKTTDLYNHFQADNTHYVPKRTPLHLNNTRQ